MMVRSSVESTVSHAVGRMTWAGIVELPSVRNILSKTIVCTNKQGTSMQISQNNAHFGSIKWVEHGIVVPLLLIEMKLSTKLVLSHRHADPDVSSRKHSLMHINDDLLQMFLF